jgi:nitrate reductase NapD
MPERRAMTRRSFITGAPAARHHISSAVIMAFPRRREEVAELLSLVPGVEVHAGEGSRIVVTIEGPSSGMLGETLVRISAMDGVISANMVFEQVDDGEERAT